MHFESQIKLFSRSRQKINNEKPIVCCKHGKRHPGSGLSKKNLKRTSRDFGAICNLNIATMLRLLLSLHAFTLTKGLYREILINSSKVTYPTQYSIQCFEKYRLWPKHTVAYLGSAQGVQGMESPTGVQAQRVQVITPVNRKDGRYGGCIGEARRILRTRRHGRQSDAYNSTPASHRTSPSTQQAPKLTSDVDTRILGVFTTADRKSRT